MANRARTIDPTELPEIITTYLEAHKARDLDVAVGSYSPDATVTDEGRTYRGREEIRAWLSRSASEFTYTIEMTGVTKLDDDHYDVMHHLEGDFPGGQADLHFRIALRDGAIAHLVIEE
jgi:ketosteroid isomerase-like protein